MKKQIKILISILIGIIVMIILQTKVQAKSYYIEDMNIEATVLQNGDVEIEQTLEYSFNGSYNGIYITIPTKYTNKEDVISEIEDKNYNASKVELKSVSLVKNEEEIEFAKVENAYNGNYRVYTEETKFDTYKIKIYSPSTNENKIFKVKYVLKDLCIKHDDVGELYYNFIGGEWQCTIKKLSINIWLPYNISQLKVWGHGLDNGRTEIVDNTHVRLKVNNVATGKYVAARVVFDKSNIINASKISNIKAYETIYKQEQKIAKISDAKQNYTKCIYLFALVLIVYWVILLVKYEKDKKYPISQINEDELFEKYNPMLAGCFQGSRDILARDIIAVVLNLIEKKNIELDIRNVNETKENYRYIIKRVDEKENEMDEVERCVYEWIFGTREQIELIDALKEMPKNKNANEKFKSLNKMVQNKLNEKGINKKGVPKVLRIFNTILFAIAVIVAIKHILYEGMEIYSNMDMIFAIFVILISMLPFTMMLLYIPILLIVGIRHKITKLIHKITGQRVIITAISIIAIFLIIIVLTILFSNPANRYLIADEILICIAIVIMLTDNLMLQNSVTMIEDYSKLNGLKDKIEDYSMMEDRDIEQITLWGKYLSYAVSFGIANKIAKRIKGLYLDDDLLQILNNPKFEDYLVSDYYFFYTHSSLDRRFMRGYERTVSDMIKNAGSGSGGSSSGSGGGFSGGGGFSRRWRSSVAAAELSKI